jgi:hypothetical protein
MGLFDSILDRVGDEFLGDDGGELLDRARDLFSGDDEAAGNDDGGGDWTDTFRDLLGGDDSDDGEAGGTDGGGQDGGGLWDTVGGFVDRLSGDGDEDGLFSGVMDKVRGFIPEDLRDEAEALFDAAGSRNGDGGSSVLGSLTDTASSFLPDGWQQLASAASGHGYGEGGLEALFDRSIRTLSGDGQSIWGGVPEDDIAARDNFRPNPVGDPDLVGDDDAPVRVEGPDSWSTDPTFPDEAPGTNGAAGDDFEPMGDAPGDPATSGLADPMDDPTPAPEPPTPEPMDDFEQSIDDADAIEDSFDSMLEGLE